MTEQEIKKELQGLSKEKKEVSRIGLELNYFTHKDMEFVRDEKTTIFDIEKLLTTRRLAQPLRW